MEQDFTPTTPTPEKSTLETIQTVALHEVEKALGNEAWRRAAQPEEIHDYETTQAMLRDNIDSISEAMALNIITDSIDIIHLSI